MFLLIFIPIIAVIITFAMRYQVLKEPECFTFNYSANTNAPARDHSYRFYVKKMTGGYRCYIEKTPSFRGRDTSHYMPHYWVEKGTEKHFICWTGNITYSEQAKTLCRNWANATQKFIDTGIPALGFER